MARRPASDRPPAAVLDAFELEPRPLERAAVGTDQPHLVRARARRRELVLQRVNPIFPAAVNLDIAAVTRHLAAQGPCRRRRSSRRRDGTLWLEHDGAVWRVLTRIDGDHAATRSSRRRKRARQAACSPSSIARSAISSTTFEHAGSASTTRARHLAALRDALDEHRGHRDFATVRPLAERVLELAAELPAAARRRPTGSCTATRRSRTSCSRATATARCASSTSTRSRGCRSRSSSATRCARGATRRPRTHASARFVRPLFDAARSRATRARRAACSRPPEWRAIPDGTLDDHRRARGPLLRRRAARELLPLGPSAAMRARARTTRRARAAQLHARASSARAPSSPRARATPRLHRRPGHRHGLAPDPGRERVRPRAAASTAPSCSPASAVTLP